MIWSEVVEKYGKKLAYKMSNSMFLRGITCTINENGEADIPERDIELAYRDVCGKPIHPEEWD